MTAFPALPIFVQHQSLASWASSKIDAQLRASLRAFRSRTYLSGLISWIKLTWYWNIEATQIKYGYRGRLIESRDLEMKTKRIPFQWEQLERYQDIILIYLWKKFKLSCHAWCIMMHARKPTIIIRVTKQWKFRDLS